MKTTKFEDPLVKVLKTAKCPTLSGSSTLTYQIGCKGDLDNPEIKFRLHASTGRGFFSKEWISTNAIHKAIEKCPASAPITAGLLKAIFQGKSINTSGFLLAVLKAEGLIEPMKDRRRYYQRADPNTFVTQIKALLASQASQSSGQPAKPAKKPAQKRKA